MLVRLSLAGLLILAHGCRSKAATGGPDGGGHGGGAAGVAGATGAGGTNAAAGTTGAAGSAGSAGTTGSAGAGGTTGVGGGPGGSNSDGGTSPDEGGADRRPDPGDAGPFYPLDMNDVTILAPLPPAGATPVLLRGTDLADDGTTFVPRALFDRLVMKEVDGSGPILMPATHGRLQLVAVRFDLCDRHLPGVCAEGEDAQMRLVFQPIFTDGHAQDVGFHAFYAIRNDEIAGAVAALRDLARSVPPQTGMLRVSPALSAANPEPYAIQLRAFVKRYGGEARLIRLTVNAQPEIFAAVRWELRGVEKKGDAFVDMTIVGSTAISESVFLGASYDVKPMTDTPSGLLGAITRTLFDAANLTKQREYLAALVAAENPLSHTPETVACVACHVSTVVMNQRAPTFAIDPLTLPGRYTSKFDLSTAGGRSIESTAIRALGYAARLPLISQRVVNDTAQTLTELEQRYPPP
jgi:hypothetical protein